MKKVCHGGDRLFSFCLGRGCRVRKGKTGRAESLSHLLRWSCQKRYTLVAQSHRLNRLHRNLLRDVPFLAAEPDSLHSLAGVAGTQPARFFLPPPLCLHKLKHYQQIITKQTRQTRERRDHVEVFLYGSISEKINRANDRTDQ